MANGPEKLFGVTLGTGVDSITPCDLEPLLGFLRSLFRVHEQELTVILDWMGF